MDNAFGPKRGSGLAPGFIMPRVFESAAVTGGFSKQFQPPLPEHDFVPTRDSDELPIVAFAGYSSAGKSTIINSINGKFVLDVGVARTTLQPQLVGPSDIFHKANPDPNINAFYHANPVSDDKVPFTMLDLPGISDAENRGEERNFDEITDAYVLMSDVVCWVSAMPDAFQRQYELDDFQRLRDLVRQQQENTGVFIQMCIVLSKYNQYDRDIAPSVRKSNGPPQRNEDGEIIRKGEHSNAQDCYERVQKLFPDVPIMKFNAFGRILHRDNISAALIQQVKDKGESANNINTCFNLRWCVDQKELRKQAHLLYCLLGKHLPEFVTGVENPFSQFSAKSSLGKIQEMQKCLDRIDHPRVLENVWKFLIIPESRDELISFWKETLLPFFRECGVDQVLIDRVYRAPAKESVGSRSTPKTGVTPPKETPRIKFKAEGFYWLCTHFGDPRKGSPSSKFNRSSKFDSIPSDASRLPCASSKFRAYLLLGRQSAVALRYFFSVTRDFKATLFHEPFRSTGSQPREIQATTVDFSDLTQNQFSPDIFFKYHKDCNSLLIASKKWQSELLKDIANVWGPEIHDLDPLALALLAREGKIRSVFCVGTSTYRSS
jgi:GTP-binding protein EngB required for normal cell division